jgi:hypothetical protein
MSIPLIRVNMAEIITTQNVFWCRELYNIPEAVQFLSEAITYGDKAGADYWWRMGRY